MGRRGEGRYRATTTTTTSFCPFAGVHAAGIISDGGAVGLGTGGHVTAVGARLLHPSAAAGGIVPPASASAPGGTGRAGLLGGGRRRGHHGLVQLFQLVRLLRLLLLLPHLLLLLHLHPLQLPGRGEANDPPVGTRSRSGSRSSKAHGGTAAGTDAGIGGDAWDDRDHPPPTATTTGRVGPLEGLAGGAGGTRTSSSRRRTSSRCSRRRGGTASCSCTFTSSLTARHGCRC